MADNNKRTDHSTDDAAVEGATPPGRGEQTHDTMRAAAMRTISGPGAADFLAAGGGLDVPGAGPGKGTSALRGDSPLTDAAHLTPRPGPDHEPIPGERPSSNAERPERVEARNPDDLTGSQTGTIGGGGVDAHNPSPNRATGMDDETVAEREREGGGAPRERRRNQ